MPQVKTLKKTLLGFAVLVILAALFYAEEDLRGWHAWNKCKRELKAKGIVLDWNAYIPPPVPDDQNFFAAPKMADWFIKGHHGDQLQDPLKNPDTTSEIKTESAARNYLTWSDQFRTNFDLIREALKRPYARMDGDYSKPYEQPIPNFVTVRIVAQTLAQRAKCDLLLGQPEHALPELTLMHDMCRLLEGPPSGKPMTLVSAMVNVAVTGLYVDTIAVGLKSHAWQEAQLTALQYQLAEIKLAPFLFEAFLDESASISRTVQISWIPKFFDNSVKAKWTTKVVWWFWPRGWTYQNMVNAATLELKPLDSFDLENDIVAPRKFEKAGREVERYVSHATFPFKIIAAIAIPNFTKAEQTMAYNQTLANEAQVVCALERYRLASGYYPATLDALVPRLIEELPHDLIGGEQLHYRHTYAGKFLLYSVGWNERDDDGQPGTLADVKHGDWVWSYP